MFTTGDLPTFARSERYGYTNSMNRLYFGDNLQWLRDAKEFPDTSVDLVYLDPPFNSNADYNVLFREASGAASQAQSTPSPTPGAGPTRPRPTTNSSTPAKVAVVEMMEAFHSFLKNSPMMAYLVMMAPRSWSCIGS